ncbi:hypothetical protein JCM18899A_41500 [Nocardioides sp. AN3]
MLVAAVLVAAVLGAALVAGRARLGSSNDGAGTHPLLRTPTASPSASPPAAVRAPWTPGAPRRLRLPTLGVTAPVVPVRAPGRTLVPPPDSQTLGWWADGARPGQPRGRVLIAGHTVHGSATGALEHIGDLEIGDPVVVATETGRLRYAVVRVLRFDKGMVARQAASLFAQDGAPRLVLITCADWDGTRFLSNTIVVAHPSAST